MSGPASLIGVMDGQKNGQNAIKPALTFGDSGKNGHQLVNDNHVS
jgi:hypothetical protein